MEGHWGVGAFISSRNPASSTATAVAVEEAGLRLDIKAPTPQCPSMTMAIEEFIKRYNKENKTK